MPPSRNHLISPRRFRALAGLVVVPSLLVAGCIDSPTALDADLLDPHSSAAEARGARVLQVVTITAGEAEGPFTLRAGSDIRPIAQNDTVTLPRRAIGPTSVELLDLAAGCRVAGENPRVVDLARVGLTRTTFEVTCGSLIPPSEAMIGTGGGIIGTELPGGGVARLTIPVGALPGGAMIRITALTPEGSERARLRLEPAGLPLAVPATLTVELPEAVGPSDRVAVRWLGQASAVPTGRVGGSVSAQLPFLGMPGPGLAAGAGAGVRSVGWRPLALFDPTDSGADEEAGVVTVDPQLAVETARLLVRAVENADSIITQDVRARTLAALMLVVSTEDGTQFAQAVATICAAVDEAMTAIRSGELTEPRMLFDTLGRRALTWEGIFQAADVDFDLPCRNASTALGEILSNIEARYSALLDQVLADAEAEDRGLPQLIFTDLPRILDLASLLQLLELDQGGGLVEAAFTRLYLRAFVVARELCSSRLGYEAYEILLELEDDTATLSVDVMRRLYREIQLCGTDLTWEVVGEEGEVRGGGTATPGDAASPNLPMVDVEARYGDRLVVRGRLDVLRCTETRTQARGEQLVVRLTSDGAFEDILSQTPDGPGVSARFFPAAGLELPLNEMAERASGEAGTEKSLALRIFRESDGCDGVLVRGLDPAFGFVRTQLTLLPLEIEPTTLSAAEVGRAYVQQLTVLNGQASSTWEQTGGALPPGVELSVDGVIAGIPSALGSYTFEVAVTSGGASVSTEMTIEVRSAITITPSSLPGAMVGQQYTVTFAATGLEGDPVWSLASGVLPPGLTLSSLGVLSGTPSQAGSFSFVVRVTIAGASATRLYSLVVNSDTQTLRVTLRAITTGETLSIPEFEPPRVEFNQPYSFLLPVQGPSDPDVSGSVTSQDGSINCTIVNGTQSGICQAVYPSGTRVVLTSRPTDGTVALGWLFPCPSTSRTLGGVGCAVTMSASGQQTAFYRTQRWSVVSGDLPPGLELDERTGLLEGWPPFFGGPGPYQVTFRVTAGGQTAERTVIIRHF